MGASKKQNESFLVYLPGGVAVNLLNPGKLIDGGNQPGPERAEYYPLFPQTAILTKETYFLAHEKLMGQMRVQTRMKNKRGIEKTGKKLHRLRKRYRARFAA